MGNHEAIIIALWIASACAVMLGASFWLALHAMRSAREARDYRDEAREAALECRDKRKEVRDMLARASASASADAARRAAPLDLTGILGGDHSVKTARAVYTPAAPTPERPA